MQTEDADRGRRVTDDDSPAYYEANSQAFWNDTEEVAASTRRAWAESLLERDATAKVRSETARVRDEAADRRDRIAEERDNAARGRDRLAALLDAELERLEHETAGEANARSLHLRTAAYRKRAAAARARGAAERAAAARDREDAARDRRLAALDRLAATEELALEGFDHLTGALRRRVGMAAMQREMARTARTGEPLVLAFVDVDGLKAVNDNQGHAAGDRLLRDTVAAIKGRLRSYDVLTRFGGDEFVCSLSGQDAAGARERFRDISRELADAESHASITVGFADRCEGDSLSDLIGRADTALRDRRFRVRERLRGV